MKITKENFKKWFNKKASYNPMEHLVLITVSLALGITSINNIDLIIPSQGRVAGYILLYEAYIIIALDIYHGIKSLINKFKNRNNKQIEVSKA